MKNEKKKIIVADDNTELCEVLVSILEDAGYDAESVNDGFSLIDYLKNNQDVDAIILDLIMPNKGGISIFETIRSISPVSRLIIYTGYTNYQHTVFGREADAFINKTDGAEKLLSTLREQLEEE